MSIPLVQEATKDAINTSIIAIKRNIERINMLLGLVDNDSPDLSGFATKQELQDAVTELQPVDEVTVGNMHSVSSNAVARAISYSTTEHQIGYWLDGKPLYEISEIFYVSDNGMYSLAIPPDRLVKKWEGTFFQDNSGNIDVLPIPYTYVDSTNYVKIYAYLGIGRNFVASFDGSGIYSSGYYHGNAVITYEYTKTTD